MNGAPPEGGARFAEGAARLAGLSALLLGWRPAEFWAATPAELMLILTALNGPATAPPTRGDLARMMKELDNG